VHQTEVDLVLLVFVVEQRFLVLILPQNKEGLVLGPVRHGHDFLVQDLQTERAAVGAVIGVVRGHIDIAVSYSLGLGEVNVVERLEIRNLPPCDLNAFQK